MSANRELQRIEAFSDGVFATTALSYWFPLIGLFIIAAVQILWIVMTVGENPGEP